MHGITDANRRQEIMMCADAGDAWAIIAWAILEVADAQRAHTNRMVAAIDAAAASIITAIASHKETTP
jgi:hypothetical protein